MNLDELTVGQLKQVATLAAGLAQTPCATTKTAHWSIGKYCVVRTYSAGVHVGVVESKDGQEVVLSGARRIWNWSGANTLNEIANGGVASGSKVSDESIRVELTQAIEIIQCTEAGEKALRSAKWMK